MKRLTPVLVAFSLLVSCARGDELCNHLAHAHVSPVAEARTGMAATSSPYATRAATWILERGGNAVDAAAAAAFALAVSDPINTSLGGRVQLLAHVDGKLVGYDGATRQPIAVPATPDDTRTGLAVASVPGLPATLARAVAEHGRMSLGDVLQPAIVLARDGFVVPEATAAVWATRTEWLSADSAAKALYLKPDGSAYRAGDLYRNPTLAQTLERLADHGVDAFYRGQIADQIASDMARRGGYIRKQDLLDYRVETPGVLTTTFRDTRVATLSGPTWGHTLMEMIGILGHFPRLANEPTGEEYELLARLVATAMEDRPQELGTLRPKPNGIPLATLTSPELAGKRAEELRAKMAAPVAAPASSEAVETPSEERHTTHLSVVDASGNAVALTTSIGKWFGSGSATAELGFLYAYSYRMRSSPEGGARDHTEMTPTIVLRNGRPQLVVGGAGSERIPGAILQVLANVVDRGWNLARAVEAPRVFAVGDNVRLDDSMPPAVVEHLTRRGLEVEKVAGGQMVGHLGIVQAVLVTADRLIGASDPRYIGRAGGPRE